MSDEKALTRIHPEGESKQAGDEAGEGFLAAATSLDTFGGKVQVKWMPEAAVGAFGQMPFFIEFLKTSGLFDGWVNDCPLRYTSRNAPKKIASEDSVRGALKSMDAEESATWLKKHLKASCEPLLEEPWALDIDTTVKPLYGHRQDAPWVTIRRSRDGVARLSQFVHCQSADRSGRGGAGGEPDSLVGCYWFEEPVVPYDHAGYAKVADERDIRIATGENEYTKFSCVGLISRHGVDVIQSDNRRAGGLTEWMEIGAIADGFGLELASHGGGPTNLHMLLAMPNAIYMETGSLKGGGSSVEKLRMVDGAVLAPETPGMGSEMRPDYIKRLRV
jgi:hypothetical protein